MIETLPRREREVFEHLCELGGATAAAVRAALPDPLSDSAVRTLLSRLEAKGLIRREMVGQTFVYSAIQTHAVALSAMKRLVQTFFGGSGVRAATALLGLDGEPDQHEIERLQQAIDDARGKAS